MTLRAEDGSPYMNSLRSQGQVAVVVTLKNLSQQIITAWKWSVEGHYANGTSLSHSATVDRISDLLGADSSLAFQPGSTHTFDDVLSEGVQGDPPFSMSADILMVAFSDQTARGDPGAISGLASLRRSRSAAIKEELDAIETARKGPHSRDTIKAMIADREANNKGAGTLPILVSIDRGDSATSVDDMIAAFRKYQNLMLQHAVLTEIH